MEEYERLASDVSKYLDLNLDFYTGVLGEIVVIGMDTSYNAMAQFKTNR